MVCSVIAYPSVVQCNWHCNKCMPRYLMQFDLILKSFYCSFCSSARFIIGISFLHISENSIRATHDIISKIQIKMEIIILVGAPLAWNELNTISFRNSYWKCALPFGVYSSMYKRDGMDTFNDMSLNTFMSAVKSVRSKGNWNARKNRAIKSLL